jgi:hypothetical protein
MELDIQYLGDSLLTVLITTVPSNLNSVVFIFRGFSREVIAELIVTVQQHIMILPTA